MLLKKIKNIQVACEFLGKEEVLGIKDKRSTFR